MTEANTRFPAGRWWIYYAGICCSPTVLVLTADVDSDGGLLAGLGCAVAGFILAVAWVHTLDTP